MEPNHLSKIADVFSSLQEGVFETLSLQDNDLNVKLACPHIASLIEKPFKYFYIVIKNIQDLKFVPWDEPEVVILNDKELQLLKLEILNLEIEDEQIRLYCNCKNVYNGGCLYFDASDIKIYDQELTSIETDALELLSEKYWFNGSIS